MSHVNMGVQPSGQDDQQMEEFAKMFEWDQGVRLIINKKGEMEATFYLFKEGITMKDLDWEVERKVSDDRATFWRSRIQESVKSLYANRAASQAASGAVVVVGETYQPYPFNDARGRHWESSF